MKKLLLIFILCTTQVLYGQVSPPCDNIDYVTIEDTTYNCNVVDFKGFAFTNTYGISSWSWDFGDNRIADSQNVTHVYKKPGAYFVKLMVTDINGCIDSVVKVIVMTEVKIRKSPDKSLCGSGPVQLVATGGTMYSWSPSTDLSNPNISNPIATPLSSTTYHVHASNADGCFDDDSIKITVNSLPVVTKSNDTSICKGSGVQLLAGGGVSYVWSPATSLSNSKIANPVAKPASSTNYTVKVTSPERCSSSDSIRVAVKPVAAITKSNDTTVCDQNSVRLSVSGGVSYSWSPSSGLDNPTSPSPIASPLSTTVYYVAITDAQACTYNDSIKVTLASLPDVQVSKLNNVDCMLPLTQLLASGAQDYSWTPVAGLNNPNISNPIASPIVSTDYTVIGKDINGCTDSATISVKVDFSGTNLYGLPNAFTPNGDGLNDCFGIKYWGRVTELSFSIYNRFGEKVFYTNNASICWDGTYKGDPQNAGVYVYMVKAITDCGNIDGKGTVTLLR